jgi:hypothetical protein
MPSHPSEGSPLMQLMCMLKGCMSLQLYLRKTDRREVATQAQGKRGQCHQESLTASCSHVHIACASQGTRGPGIHS